MDGKQLGQILREIRWRLLSLRELGFEVWLAHSGKAKVLETSKEKVMTHQSSTSNNKEKQLAALAMEVEACRKCELGALRTKSVFGVGNPDADLVFIGEAPGANEDATGIPFVGAAGNLLTQELDKNGISRDEVYICNILKCRPPGNRDPLPHEIEACEPYLLRQLDTLKPKMLCGLGRFAVMTLLGRPISIMKIRGTWQSYHGIPLFVCLHPAAALHQPKNLALFQADIATLAQAYHRRFMESPAVSTESLI